MKLIVGLGNIDIKYRLTRHNVGFILLDKYLKDISPTVDWKIDKKFNALMCRVGNILYSKPQTNMNLSGKAVSKVSNYYDISPDDITVVHDDVDLEFGTVRKAFSSGSAGHKGVQSIIDEIGTKDFHRVRVGVGRSPNPNISTEDWVLMDFTRDELEKIYGVELSLYIG